MNFVKENKETFTAIKTTTRHKCVTNLHNAEALRKLHIRLEILSCL